MYHRPMQIIHDFRILGQQTGDLRVGLQALLAQGIGGIVANMPFDDYMQDAATWQQFRAFLRTCRDLGMRVWLYDEKGYPSGFAGGQVLARRPDLEAIGLYRDDATGQLAEATSYEGTHNCNNCFARARTANLLEAETADEFIRVTHERYAAELGPDLAIVEAFFTDEPALNVMYFPLLPEMRHVPALDPPDPDRRLLPGIPWSRALATHYGTRDLTGLFCAQPDAAALRRDFYSRIGDRLSVDFFGRLRAWCRAHGLFSSGHLLWEERAENHTPLYGNFLRCLLQLDIPGIDVLTATPLWGYRESHLATVLAASAAMLNGTRRVFTESSDHNERISENRMLSVSEISASLGWQAALGVTDFTSYFAYGVCPELHGETFDALPEDRQRISRSPADYLAINNSISDLVAQLGAADLSADVFLYYPIEQLQAAYAPVLQPWDTGSRPAELMRIAGAYHAAVADLLDAGIMPCLIDGMMLREVRQEAGGGYAVLQAHANAIVCPAGCEPPDDCRPAAGIAVMPMTPELPHQLYAQGKTRIYKDNPEVCAGVMRSGEHTLVTLVNLTDHEQTCHIQSRAGDCTKQLAAYQVMTMRCAACDGSR